MHKLDARTVNYVAHVYVLTIDNLDPARPAVTERLIGSLASIRTQAASMIRETAAGWGVSPLALAWSVEAAR